MSGERGKISMAYRRQVHYIISHIVLPPLTIYKTHKFQFKMHHLIQFPYLRDRMENNIYIIV